MTIQPTTPTHVAAAFAERLVIEQGGATWADVDRLAGRRCPPAPGLSM